VRYEEGVLLPILSLDELHTLFGLSRQDSKRVIDCMHEEQALSINAFEAFSVALFTADMPLYERARRLFLLYGECYRALRGLTWSKDALLARPHGLPQMEIGTNALPRMRPV
jgi:hypothetical protein